MSQTTRRSLLKTLGVGGTVFAFGAGAGYAQTDAETDSDEGEGVTLPPSGDTALLRALHASPDAPAVDVYVDGEQAAQGVEFGNISGYLELSPGAVDVQVYPSEEGGEDTTGAENETTTESDGLGDETTTEAGAAAEDETTTEAGAMTENETGTESEGLGNETETETETEMETETESTAQMPSGDPVIDETVTVEGGQSYTVAAINQLDDIEALVLEDEPEDDGSEDDEGSNTAMVRAVHLSPDAPTVKVRADSHVVAGAIDYEEASDYADVQTGNTQVEVLPTGSADPVSTAAYEFEAGERYNLFLVGMVDPEAATAEGGLATETDAENETTTESGMGVENETTTESGMGVENETTTESGMAAENETTTESGMGVENETTTESGMAAENETTTESEMAAETTTESEMAAETTTESGMGAENETTTESGTATDDSEDQPLPEAFRIVGVQDSTGSVLEEAEEEGTPSADDLLPVDLSGDDGSDENATTENGTTATETAENDTATNGTTTEASNATTTSD